MLGLIPIHDDNPTRRPAVVNWTLIAVNVVVFFLSPISPLDIGGDANTPAGFCRQLAFFRLRQGGLQPGPLVGRAYKFLLELRLDRGPIGKDAAREALLDWAREEGLLQRQG